MARSAKQSQHRNLHCVVWARGKCYTRRSWAAEAVAEKIDVLLERATDAVLGAPRPGSEAWQQAWAARDTAAGRAASAHRAQAKTSIAVAAGVDPSRELERARRAGILAGETATESPKKPNRCPRSGHDDGQLPMWRACARPTSFAMQGGAVAVAPAHTWPSKLQAQSSRRPAGMT